ncbi:MAG: hypothetical protein GC185_13545 [Alphaproteobacteria bacterium]|nr:hypothetical protein [Alphaproteobacteria bacterium]
MSKPKPAKGANPFNEAAAVIARTESSDAVTEALNDTGGNVAKKLAAQGLDPAEVFALASGKTGGQDVKVKDLAAVALALGKTLKITID